MTPRFQLVPAAYVYLLRDDDGAPASPPTGATRVLLQLRQNTGYMDGHWAAAAAGHVEEGESVLEAACREVREELGIGIAPDALLPLTAMHRTHGNHEPIDERVDFFFTARSWSGEPRIVEPEKCAELAWFALDALPEPLVPHEAAVLAGLRSGDLAALTHFGF